LCQFFRRGGSAVEGCAGRKFGASASAVATIGEQFPTAKMHRQPGRDVDAFRIAALISSIHGAKLRADGIRILALISRLSLISAVSPFISPLCQKASTRQPAVENVTRSRTRRRRRQAACRELVVGVLAVISGWPSLLVQGDRRKKSTAGFSPETERTRPRSPVIVRRCT